MFVDGCKWTSPPSSLMGTTEYFVVIFLAGVGVTAGVWIYSTYFRTKRQKINLVQDTTDQITNNENTEKQAHKVKKVTNLVWQVN